MMRLCVIVIATLVVASSAVGQDIRALEKCTAEKSMERRTSCLQSNTEFLQQAAARQTQDMRRRLDAAGREAATQAAEIAALKNALTKLEQELADLKKAKPDKK